MPPHSRRRFIQTTLSATLAAALADMHSRRAMAGALDSDASRTLRIAIIGAGRRGTGHIIEWSRQPNCEIAAICDVDRSKTAKSIRLIKQTYQKVGESAPQVKAYADLREVLEDDSIDAVSIATPNHWHALGGIWAMQAGKDAYIEKPVCHTIAEGAALVAAARKHNRICQAGTQCRSSNAIQDAIAYMNSGAIGEVTFARGLCYKRRPSIGPLGDYRVPGSVHYNLWTGPAPYTTPRLTRPNLHYDWHFQRLYGNGDLGNQGPHQTDIARWGLGLDRHPNSVITYGGRLGYKAERGNPNDGDAGNTANTCVSIYDYGDKCIVFETRGLDVKGSDDEEINRLFQRGPKQGGNVLGVIFHGADGFVVQQNYDYCTAWDRNYNKIREFRGEDDHIANFVTACRSRDRSGLHADIREGHLSAAISHLGNISYYLGEHNLQPVAAIGRVLAGIPCPDDNLLTLRRTADHLTANGVDLADTPLSMGPRLTFDPDKEVFPNSPKATALCRRTYRDGFECPTVEKITSS